MAAAKHTEQVLGLVQMQVMETYIVQCRTNWYLGIRPLDNSAKDRKEYQALIKIAQIYFVEGRDEEFSNYFMEGQYLIPLWTAHLILEYGKPTPVLKDKCIKVITDYADNPLTPDVAKEERKWLDQYNKSN